MRPGNALWLLPGLVLAGMAGACESSDDPTASPAEQTKAPEPEVSRQQLMRKARERLKAEKAKLREQLREVGTTEVVSTKLVGTKEQRKLDVRFKFTNHSDKELVQAEGAVRFHDQSGELLKQLKVPFRETIKPGESATKRGRFPLDKAEPGDVAVGKTPLAKLKVEWLPRYYRFGDGTTMRAE